MRQSNRLPEANLLYQRIDFSLRFQVIVNSELQRITDHTWLNPFNDSSAALTA